MMMVTGILSIPYGIIEPLRRCGPAIQQQTFAPVTDSTRFATAIATRHTHRPMGGGLLDMTLLARPTTGVVVQIFQRQHHFNVTVRPRMDFTVVQWAQPRVPGTDPRRQAPVPRAAPALPAPMPRMNFTVVQWAQPRVAGTDPGRQAPAPAAAPALPAPMPRMDFTVVQWAHPRVPGTDSRQQAPVPAAARALPAPGAAPALPAPLPRLELAIDTELVYRRLTERVERATSEKLVQRLVAREQRIELPMLTPTRPNPTAVSGDSPPMVVRRAASPSPPVSSESRYGGQPTTDPMRQASFPSSGPQMQAALRRGEPSRPSATAPPLNIGQLADEVLTVIDRRLVAARERLGKR